MYTCILENKTSRKEMSAQYLRDGGQEHEAGPRRVEKQRFAYFHPLFYIQNKIAQGGKLFFREIYKGENQFLC